MHISVLQQSKQTHFFVRVAWENTADIQRIGFGIVDQGAQVVILVTVEDKDQRDGTVKVFCGLMQMERAHFKLIVLVIVSGAPQKAIGKMKLFIEIILSHFPYLGKIQFAPPRQLIFAGIEK